MEPLVYHDGNNNHLLLSKDVIFNLRPFARTAKCCCHKHGEGDQGPYKSIWKSGWQVISLIPYILGKQWTELQAVPHLTLHPAMLHLCKFLQDSSRYLMVCTNNCICCYLVLWYHTLFICKSLIELIAPSTLYRKVQIWVLADPKKREHLMTCLILVQTWPLDTLIIESNWIMADFQMGNSAADQRRLQLWMLFSGNACCTGLCGWIEECWQWCMHVKLIRVKLFIFSIWLHLPWPEWNQISLHPYDTVLFIILILSNEMFITQLSHIE